MDIVDCLEELGGVARRSELVARVGRVALDRAVAAEVVVQDVRGWFALPDADDAVRRAAELGGVVSLTSAALLHGWAVKTLPDKPHVTVGRGRRSSRHHRRAHVHWVDLRPDEVEGGVTSPARTLRDCLRLLPPDEALAIADSALRAGFGAQSLLRLADEARGPGSPQVRRVARSATPLAANPFESVVRSIAESVPGLRVVPQVTISLPGFSARPDLVDERLRIVCEADSFEWHGGRAALARDARRYNELVVGGWVVLRFSYEEVMFHPEAVHDVLCRAVALAEVLVEVTRRRGAAA